MKGFLQVHRAPDHLVDKNLRTDYAKIRYLVTVNRRINGNYHRLEEIIAEKGCTVQIEDSFQARELTKGDNFVSLLFYFGLLAIKRGVRSRVELIIPNLTVQEFINDFVPRVGARILRRACEACPTRYRLPGRRPRPLRSGVNLGTDRFRESISQFYTIYTFYTANKRGKKGNSSRSLNTASRH